VQLQWRRAGPSSRAIKAWVTTTATTTTTTWEYETRDDDRRETWDVCGADAGLGGEYVFNAPVVKNVGGRRASYIIRGPCTHARTHARTHRQKRLLQPADASSCACCTIYAACTHAATGPTPTSRCIFCTVALAGVPTYIYTHTHTHVYTMQLRDYGGGRRRRRHRDGGGELA